VISAGWSSLPLGETGQVTYQATVPGYPAINLGDTLTNTAALAWTSLPGVVPGERTGADGEGGALNDYADVTSATLTVSGPDLSLSKDDGGIVSGAGQVIVYALVVENNGNTPADNVTLSDDVPDNTVFDAAGSDAGWTCADGAPPGTTCTNNLGTLDPGETQTVDFAVRVDDPLAAGVITVTNSAVVTEDATHGPEPSLDDNTDSDTTPVTAVPDLQVTKDDSLSIVTAGQTLAYAVQYANVGEQDATGVVLTETVPVDTVFLPGSSTPGWACVPDNTAGSTCTLDIGDLGGGESDSATFTVRVNSDADEAALPNTIQIADDGTNGPDANPDDNTFTDTDRLAGAGDLSKILVATNQAFTVGSEAAIGELLTYQITVNVHPGTMPGLSLTDVLDQGLAFVECESITASADVVTDLVGGFEAACNAPANPTVTDLSAAPVDAGRQITFSLGTVSNATGATGTLTIRYVVAVLDAAEVQRGGTLANSATLTWTGGTLSDSSDSVRVIEPTLALTKTAAPRTVPPGGIVTFTLEVSHAPVSDSPAFDLILEDTVPLGLTYVPGSLAATLGGVVDDTAAPLLVVTWTDIDEADTATVTFQATVGDLPPGTEIENVADLIWSSLPGDVTEPQSAFNLLSRERVYDPGVDARITVTLPALPATGFAPGRLTDLPAAPAAAPYADLGDLWLEIPSLGLKIPIVGVPAGPAGWDLTWLWDQAGYLEGTAFPTRPGNSALTGHVYLPDGQPGPFLALKDLAWGQRIIVHYGAASSIYEVRQVKHVSPNDLSPLRHEDQSWLTLITCEDYLAARDRYARRLVVRAVLVQVRD
jgi:LPXTG-site transpeptidase (sortase) family protein